MVTFIALDSHTHTPFVLLMHEFGIMCAWLLPLSIPLTYYVGMDWIFFLKMEFHSGFVGTLTSFQIGVATVVVFYAKACNKIIMSESPQKSKTATRHIEYVFLAITCGKYSTSHQQTGQQKIVLWNKGLQYWLVRYLLWVMHSFCLLFGILFIPS